jgi:thiamine biosynthesis protein ThiI
MSAALIRFAGELTTKARRTRGRFQRRLARNLREGLRRRGSVATVVEDWSRFYVENADDAALSVLPHLFGISSFSRIEAECPASLPDIVRTGTNIYADRVKGRTYAVRARRTGRHAFGSMDVMQELGAALNPGATVDLGNPEVLVEVEVRGEQAIFVGAHEPGPGGLPLGVQDRAIALISGGFDSVVAAWMMMKRGVEIDYLFCNLAGGAYKRLVLEVTHALFDEWAFGSRPVIHVLDFSAVADELRRAVKPQYVQVVLKRMMYRAACAVGEETGAQAIVTGEAIGQVSSQTLVNLRAIEDVATLPVLRPLVGFDKRDIVDQARHIGTYELSARVREYCQLVPDRPVTAASAEAARRNEVDVDPAILERAIEGREILKVYELDAFDIVAPNLFVEDIGPDAVVIDTRTEADYRTWHWPDAIQRDADELNLGFRDLDRELTYVFYCAEGTSTAHLAERMQAEGYEAYSFRQGLRGVRRLAAQRGLLESAADA